MKNRFSAIVAIFIAISMSPLHALEIPVLTWEQGKAQSIVLGGPTASQNWKVELVSKNSSTKIDFKSSGLNKDGFRVFTAQLPSDLITGNYSIESSGIRSPRTVVAQVIIIPQEVYEIPRAPFDLLNILLMLLILFFSFGTLRSRSLVLAEFRDNLSDLRSFANGSGQVNFYNLEFTKAAKIRVKVSDFVQPGVIRYIIDTDSSWLYKQSKSLFGYLPIFGALLGALYFLTASGGRWLEPSGKVLIALMLLLSFLDNFSGMVGAFTIVFSTLLFSRDFGIIELFTSIIVVSAFLVPALSLNLGLLLRNVNKFKQKIILFYSIGVGIVSHALCFSLLKSINVVPEIEIWSLIFNCALIVIFSLWKSHALVQELIEVSLELEDVGKREKLLALHRNLYPALTISILLTTQFYLWTQSIRNSTLSALLWTFPILIYSLDINSLKQTKIIKIPRNVLVELILVLSTGLIIFYKLQDLPILVEDRSAVLLIAMSLPLILHSIFVFIAESFGKVYEVSR